MPEPTTTADAIHYDEVITSRGLKVPFVPAIITPAIEKPLRSGRYEAGERGFLEDLLRPDDIVLDLGTGLGLVAATAARHSAKVISVEAQPDLLPLIRETWALNSIDNAHLVHGIATTETGPPAPYYVRGDFWASSFEPDSRPYIREEQVACLALSDLLAEHKPTVICCDIEGAELTLFDTADLSGIRAVIVETHPKVYGEPAREILLAKLAAKGLIPRAQDKPSTVYILDRAPIAPTPEIKWPPVDPRVLVATCMKDEGPFILEWLAWHKAVGVTDIVVFSNDCTDGTDMLLDRLDAMGELTHLPNPASVQGSKRFQPIALDYVQHMPVFRAADFFLSMDVDEFINVRTGDGTLADLFAAVPAFDVLSMSEINHGSNDQQTYQRGWVTELFPGHDTTTPGQRRARTGVKSIVRLSDRIEKVRNHRPDLAAEALWLDGSGQPMHELATANSENGVDSRGRRNLVSLEHFALRSLDSYLVKMHRGDVVVDGKQVSMRYWRQRNRSEHRDHDLNRGIAKARQIHARFEADRTLMALHDSACAAHEARIAELLNDPAYLERRNAILAL